MVCYGDESYFSIGRACTNLTGRWRALSTQYFLLLSCWPSGFPNNATRMTLSPGGRHRNGYDLGVGTPGLIQQKKDKECILFTRISGSSRNGPEEKASREYLGGSVQQDGYWSKDQDKRPGPYLRGASR